MAISSGFSITTQRPRKCNIGQKKLDISHTQVTSFTDGTKLQLEQALVANGLGADIAVDGHEPLLNNSEIPSVGVVAIAKRPFSAGYRIERGISSFDVRGIAIRIADDPDHVPIGLLSNAIVKHSIEPGQRIRFQDVDLPDSLTLTAWRAIRDKVLLAQN